MSGFYKVSEWIMRFSVVNVLWILFNIPFVFLVINMVMTDKIADFIVLLGLALVLAPFLFFPGTAALFASCRDWILDKERKSLVRAFWGHYLENYKQSFIGGIFLTALWAIWLVDMYFFYDINLFTTLLFVVMGGLLFVFNINFFSVVVHYNVGFKQILTNTLLISVGSPVLFFVVLISSAFIFYANLYAPVFLMLFFTGTLYAFINFSAFYRVYLRLTERYEASKNQE